MRSRGVGHADDGVVEDRVRVEAAVAVGDGAQDVRHLGGVRVGEQHGGVPREDRDVVQRDPGPATSQSKTPASSSPSNAMLYIALSWWQTISPGAQRALDEPPPPALRGGSRRRPRGTRAASASPTGLGVAERLPADVEHPAGQEREDLAAAVVDAQHAGDAGEPGAGQEVEQLVHRGRPRAGRAADGVADADGPADVPAGQRDLVVGAVGHGDQRARRYRASPVAARRAVRGAIALRRLAAEVRRRA